MGRLVYAPNRSRSTGFALAADPEMRDEGTTLLRVSGHGPAERLDRERRAGAQIQDGVQLQPAQLDPHPVRASLPWTADVHQHRLGKPAVRGEDGKPAEQIRQVLDVLLGGLALEHAGDRQLLP